MRLPRADFRGVPDVTLDTPPLRGNRELAASLVAAGEFRRADVAEACGVSIDTIREWKRDRRFRERVAEYREAIARTLLHESLAMRQNRIAGYNDLWMRLRQVIDERGEDPAMEGVPGGKTGLVRRITKAVGRAQEIVEDFEVDTATVQALLQVQRQAAQELGQWVDQTRDVDREAIVERIEQLVAELAAARARGAGAGAAPPALPDPGN